MTNYEHMSEEEKKLAIINGIHVTYNKDRKICPVNSCYLCMIKYRHEYDECNQTAERETRKWLDSEYIPPKTENEKFCETLKEGEIIVVWNSCHEPRVRKFLSYDKETDSIQCIAEGYISSNFKFMRYDFEHGRKLTPEEKGEE